ncbi:MAG: sugar transferase [Bacteroidota bacterium]
MSSKRFFDLIVTICASIIFVPIIFVAAMIVFFEDFHNPFYLSKRIGKGMKVIKVIKLRSMVINADKTIIRTTTTADVRITKVGKFIRKYKIDELPQFFNVLAGNMSLIGPRPNVWENGVEFYSIEENGLLSIKPGISDFSSIIFADLGEIVAGQNEPDEFYNEVVRPWKSKFGLLYVQKQTLLLDMKLLFCTGLNLVNREKALVYISQIVKKISPDKDMYIVSRRNVLFAQIKPSIQVKNT